MLVLVAFAVIPNKLESALADPSPHVEYAGQAGTVTGLPSTSSQVTMTEDEGCRKKQSIRRASV